MGASVLFMSMSVDGFVAAPNDTPDNPGGDDFDRLHEWGLTPDLTAHRTDGVAGQVNALYHETGAVLAGRRTAEQANYWGGAHHGVPTFVLSRTEPEARTVESYPRISWVTDGIASAMAQAKEAAGPRDVLVHGAVTATAALEVGLLDEIQLHLVPVLFGAGKRLIDVLPHRVDLDIVRVIDTPEATHLRYRVRS